MTESETTAGERAVVLVVEDDPLTQGYVATVLRRLFEPIIASSASEARAQLAAHPDVAVVLMDLSLKGDEDGLTLTRWLRAEPRWAKLPIIATTAHALVEDERSAIAAGCDLHLAKPISPRALVTAIQNILERGADARPGPRGS